MAREKSSTPHREIASQQKYPSWGSEMSLLILAMPRRAKEITVVSMAQWLWQKYHHFSAIYGSGSKNQNL